MGWVIVARSVSIVGLAVLGLSHAACGDSAPATDAPASATVAPPSQPLTGATPAPGSDQFKPDEHPELAYLNEVTMESLAKGVEGYVKAEAERNSGVFPVHDPEQQTTLNLTLLRVHRDRLSQLADGRYFACADFKGTDGHTYDVDVFMVPESTGGLRPTDVIVHTQDGKARFNWRVRDGIWSQSPVPTP